MNLEYLILTQDLALLGQLQSGLGTQETTLHLRQDSESGIEFVSRRHLDGVVIDCDDVPGGAGVIAHLKRTPANKQTLILAISNGLTSAEEALDLGADFVVSKPIQPARLRSVLDIAIPRIEREHRRYFRYDVDLPVRFQNHLGQSFSARMQNVSEGGLAIKLIDPVRLKGVIGVEFELPSIERQLVRAKAEIVWSDSFVMGLHFLYTEKQSGVALQAWLSSLEARFRFHESAARN